MSWPRGKRRNHVDASRFVSALAAEFGSRRLADLIGVSDRTIRRWASGEDWCSRDVCLRMTDRLFDRGAPLYEPSGALPVYDPSMAIDGNTRVGGVGEYTLRSSAGLL